MVITVDRTSPIVRFPIAKQIQNPQVEKVGLLQCNDFSYYKLFPHRFVLKIHHYYIADLEAQIRWTGHVKRMEQNDIPRRWLYWKLLCRRRHEMRAKKRYKGRIITNLHWCKIKTKELEKCTVIVHQTSAIYGKVKCQNIQREQHQNATLALVTTTEFQCPHSTSPYRFKILFV